MLLRSILMHLLSICCRSQVFEGCNNFHIAIFFVITEMAKFWCNIRKTSDLAWYGTTDIVFASLDDNILNIKKLVQSNFKDMYILYSSMHTFATFTENQ